MRAHIQSVKFRFEWPAYIIRWPELKWKATECRPQLEHRWPSWTWDNSMVLMESYFFCASVRLGVLVTCIAAIVSLILYQMVANTSCSHPVSDKKHHLHVADIRQRNNFPVFLHQHSGNLLQNQHDC